MPRKRARSKQNKFGRFVPILSIATGILSVVSTSLGIVNYSDNQRRQEYDHLLKSKDERIAYLETQAKVRLEAQNIERYIFKSVNEATIATLKQSRHFNSLPTIATEKAVLQIDRASCERATAELKAYKQLFKDFGGIDSIFDSNTRHNPAYESSQATEQAN